MRRHTKDLVRELDNAINVLSDARDDVWHRVSGGKYGNHGEMRAWQRKVKLFLITSMVLIVFAAVPLYTFALDSLGRFILKAIIGGLAVGCAVILPMFIDAPMSKKVGDTPVDLTNYAYMFGDLESALRKYYPASESPEYDLRDSVVRALPEAYTSTVRELTELVIRMKLLRLQIECDNK